MDRLLRLIQQKGPARPIDPAKLAEVERGLRLPPGFRELCLTVGAATWPVVFLDVITLEPRDDLPPGVLPFATDAFGNEWCFDTRREGSPVLFWDHEERALEDAVSESFDEWLDDQVSTRLEEDAAEHLEQRQAALEAALLPHRETDSWPWAPGEDQVEEVERALGVTLPRDYVWFTTHLGSTRWPVEVVDALELEGLTAALRERFPDATTVAFGRDVDGAFLTFDEHGAVVCVGGADPGAPSFFDFLDRRVSGQP